VPEYLAWVPMLLLIVILGILPGLLFGITDDAVQTSLEGLRALGGG
jgi:NADH:ubiquinone oxidoreductase subunit 4 (subunit M)